MTNQIFEVQKYGTTVEWTDSLKKAQEAFKQTSSGGVVLYCLQGSVKRELQTK